MDKDKIPYRQLPEDACLSEQQLYGYMDGTLSHPEQHAVEKHLLDCDFCSDALAGLELVTDRTRIAAIPLIAAEEPATPPVPETKKTKGRIIPFYRSGRTYAAAAALVLIVAVTWFFNTTTRSESANKLSDNTIVQSAESPAAAEAKQTSADSLIATTNEQQRIADYVPADGEENGPEKNNNLDNKQTEDLYNTTTLPKPAAPVSAGTYALADKTEPVATGKKAIASEEAKAPGTDDIVYRDEARLKEDRRKEQANDREVDLAKNTTIVNEAEKGDFDASYKTQTDTVKLAANNMITSGSPVTLSSTANGGATYTWSSGTADSFAKPASTNVGFVSTGATTVTQNQNLSEVVTTSRSNTKFELFKDNSAKKSKAAAVPTVSGESQKTAPLSDNDKYNRALTEINSNRNESALVILNEILTNTASPLYADAQWQKAVVLIKLNKKAEAKTILQEIVKKGGKYKPLAESQLKQL